jgi:hypothetical protein
MNMQVGKVLGGQYYSLRAERIVVLFDRFAIRLHHPAVDVSACEPVHVTVQKLIKA